MGQHRSTTENDNGDSRERRLVKALGLLVGWKAPRFRTFRELFGPLSDWFDGPSPDIDDESYQFLTKTQRRTLRDLHDQGVAGILERADGWTGQILVFDDDLRDTGLGDISKPPAALHVVGDARLLKLPGLAVVGSRDIGVSTAAMARRILEYAIARGLNVISGGARGADAVAHRAAVDGGGSTVVVLPSGIHNPSPKGNRRLFGDVVDAGGLIVSEYSPQQGVRAYHFKRRNSLIVGISRGVLALRAGQDSGTMLTVDAARKLDRPRGAVPGNPDDPMAWGCLDILRNSGQLIATGEDLVDWWTQLAPEYVEHVDDSSRARQLQLDAAVADCEILAEARQLVDSAGAFGVEELARRTDTSAAELQTLLLEHELSGHVERIAGGSRFRLVTH